MKLMNLIRKTRSPISASVVDSPISTVGNVEKRKSLRFQQDFEVEMLDSDKRPATEAVRLVDMSLNGIGIETSRRFSVGETLGLQMAVAGGKVLQARARVRWEREDGIYNACGLEIEGLGLMDRSRLLRALKPDYFGLPELVNLVLQASATLLAAYVAVDWITSDPAHMQAAVFALPWLIYSGAVAIGAWIAYERA